MPKPRIFRIAGIASLTAVALLSGCTASPVEPDPELVSVNLSGSYPVGGAGWAGVSADGSVVAFASGSSDLVAGDNNGVSDIFVRDRHTGQTTRVSVASDGTEANDNSTGWTPGPALSADGRFVAFSSFASNLVPGDTNGVQDVFVHDRQTGETTRVSVASDGTQGDLPSLLPGISADGRYVAFYSSATNLVPGDTNRLRDTFVHDRLTGQTTRVSVASDGSQGEFYRDWSPIVESAPSFSADGRYVAFLSLASNLVPGDTNKGGDVFVHDRVTGVTSLVSASLSDEPGDLGSLTPALSADGRYVVFASTATDLVADVPPTSSALPSVYVRDLQANSTRLVSQNWSGTERVQGFVGSISGNGRYVTWDSDSDQVVFGLAPGGGRSYVTDLWSGVTKVIAPDAIAGRTVLRSGWSKVSTDGTTVVFDALLNSATGNPNYPPPGSAVFAVGLPN